jgi:hypothetical protein
VCQPYAPATCAPKEISPIIFSIRCWVNPRDMQREGINQIKIPLIPSGIRAATFRLVAQCLNQLRRGLFKLNNNYSVHNIVNCSSKWFCCRKFLSFHSSIFVVYILLWCGAASLGYWLSTFWYDVLFSSSRVTTLWHFDPWIWLLNRRLGTELGPPLCYSYFFFQGTRVAERLGASFWQ